MLKKFTPIESTDNNDIYELPLTYSGGDINVFINGILYTNVVSNNGDVEEYTWTLINSIPNKLVLNQKLTINDSISLIYDDIETSNNSNFGNGIIELESNTWQMCAIPMKYGYWDKTQHKIVNDNITRSTVKNVIIDQLEDVYNTNANNLVEVINTYNGDIGYYYNYIPGLIPDNSEHNFNLIYIDDDYDSDSNIKEEVSAFLIKVISNNALKIEWGN